METILDLGGTGPEHSTLDGKVIVSTSGIYQVSFFGRVRLAAQAKEVNVELYVNGEPLPALLGVAAERVTPEATGTDGDDQPIEATIFSAENMAFTHFVPLSGGDEISLALTTDADAGTAFSLGSARFALRKTHSRTRQDMLHQFTDHPDALAGKVPSIYSGFNRFTSWGARG